MSEIERLVDQYDRVLNGDAWHGDNVWKILGALRPEEAFHRILPDAHTIWELVAHMTFWETAVYRCLKGLPELPAEDLNFPPMPEATVENWSQTLDEFRLSNANFRGILVKIQDSQLDEPLSSPEKSVYVEVNGVIQHHLYHAGQIAILRSTLTGRKVATGL